MLLCGEEDVWDRLRSNSRVASKRLWVAWLVGEDCVDIYRSDRVLDIQIILTLNRLNVGTLAM